jgi:hypothetical protein
MAGSASEIVDIMICRLFARLISLNTLKILRTRPIVIWVLRSRPRFGMNERMSTNTVHTTTVKSNIFQVSLKYRHLIAISFIIASTVKIAMNM